MKKVLISFAVLSVLGIAITAGISPAVAQSGKSPAAAVVADDVHMGAVTVEQCLECHGSYAENAKNTEKLGDWNPHDSIHGGYVDCMNCHTYQVLTRNYCAFCHVYKPDPLK